MRSVKLRMSIRSNFVSPMIRYPSFNAGFHNCVQELDSFFDASIVIYTEKAGPRLLEISAWPCLAVA